MVSSLSIAFMILSILLALGIPIGLIIYFRKRYHIRLKTVLIGAGFFFIFTQILEKTLHYFVLGPNLNNAIMHYPFLFALYGALAAGVFEEGGRWIAFSKILKVDRRWEDGVAYGLGHGGIEAILIGGLASLQLLIFSLLINTGKFGDIAKQLPVSTAISLRDTLLGPSFFFLLIGVERIFTLAIQIALSLVVLYGIRKQNITYLFYAIGLHALIDFPAALFQAKVLNIWIVEIILVITFVICLLFIQKVKRAFVFDHKEAAEVHYKKKITKPLHKGKQNL